MADTPRTLTELLTLWADNVLGAISPQDGRDLIVSAFSGYGSIYVTGGSTAQAITSTPSKVTGFAANGIFSNTTPDHTTDQITILTAGDYDIVMLAGSFIGSNSSTIVLDIYVNGSPSGLPSMARALGTPAAPGSGGTVGQLTIAANDILTVYVSSPTGSSFTPQEVMLKIDRLS